jgi:hypothetical protein
MSLIVAILLMFVNTLLMFVNTLLMLEEAVEAGKMKNMLNLNKKAVDPRSQ